MSPKRCAAPWFAAHRRRVVQGGDRPSRRSRGTNARSASATQACSSAAAVPLVTTTTTGRAVASARPSAKKPALRSSRRTCTVSSLAYRRGQDERASNAIRERAPHRGARVAPTDQRASRQTWPAPRWRSVRYVTMSLLGLERDGSGPAPRVAARLHPNKNSGHQFRSILAGTYEVLTIDLPGHGENAATPPSSTKPPICSPTRCPRSLHPRGLLTWWSCRPALSTSSSKAVSHLASSVRRRESSTTMSAGAPSSRRTAREENRAVGDRCLSRRMARPADVRVAATRPARARSAEFERAGSCRVPASCGHGHASLARAEAR